MEQQVINPIDSAANNLALLIITNAPSINPKVCGSMAAADVVYGTVRLFTRLAALQSPYLVDDGKEFSGEQLECVIDSLLAKRTRSEFESLVNEYAVESNVGLIQALRDGSASFFKPICFELFTDEHRKTAVKLIQSTYGVGVPVAVST